MLNMVDSLSKAIIEYTSKGYSLNPIISESDDYRYWVVNFTLTTCDFCADLDGRIFYNEDALTFSPPAHQRCRCVLLKMKSILAGTATIKGTSGVDWYLKNYGVLPNNYITKKEAEVKGWDKSRGNLRDILSGAIIGGDKYYDKDNALPAAIGRTWYEADINYVGGYRGEHRLVYSNDGLVLVTYDHFNTFYPIR